MRFEEVDALVADERRKASEFRVSFERRENGMLYSDYIPERDETPFATEEDAWEYAKTFARLDPLKYVNVYVVGGDFSPVEGYRARMMNVYPRDDQ